MFLLLPRNEPITLPLYKPLQLPPILPPIQGPQTLQTLQTPRRTLRQGGENEQEGTHFIAATSLRIFSSGNAKRRVNGMCTTHFSSVSPSSERKTMGKQITLTLSFLSSQKTQHSLRLG